MSNIVWQFGWDGEGDGFYIASGDPAGLRESILVPRERVLELWEDLSEAIEERFDTIEFFPGR